MSDAIMEILYNYLTASGSGLSPGSMTCGKSYPLICSFTDAFISLKHVLRTCYKPGTGPETTMINVVTVLACAELVSLVGGGGGTDKGSLIEKTL